MYRVLALDDEPNILNALRRCLSALRGRGFPGLLLECFTAAGPALGRLEAEDFDLVLCDYRMPGMNGIEFLSHVIDLQPGAARMLMSAYADRNAVVAAINEAQIARFVCKPWDEAELQEAVTCALLGRSHAPAAPANAELRARHRLERDCPGITRVETDEQGGIILSSMPGG